jgi:hypothetical protein
MLPAKYCMRRAPFSFGLSSPRISVSIAARTQS